MQGGALTVSSPGQEKRDPHSVVRETRRLARRQGCAAHTATGQAQPIRRQAPSAEAAVEGQRQPIPRQAVPSRVARQWRELGEGRKDVVGEVQQDRLLVHEAAGPGQQLHPPVDLQRAAAQQILHDAHRLLPPALLPPTLKSAEQCPGDEEIAIGRVVQVRDRCLRIRHVAPGMQRIVTAAKNMPYPCPSEWLTLRLAVSITRPSGEANFDLKKDQLRTVSKTGWDTTDEVAIAPRKLVSTTLLRFILRVSRWTPPLDGTLAQRAGTVFMPVALRCFEVRGQHRRPRKQPAHTTPCNPLCLPQIKRNANQAADIPPPDRRVGLSPAAPPHARRSRPCPGSG